MATKKPKKIKISPEKIDPSQVAPGQKQEIIVKLKKATSIKDKINDQMQVLQQQYTQAKNIKQWQQVSHVKGLAQKLTQLQKLVTEEIESLQQQLRKVTQPDVATVALMQQISQNCKNYLQAVKKSKKWLYRGSSGADQYVARSWQDRRPRDSNQDAQQLFDHMLAQLGFTALRGNSIFTTSDHDHASQFGSQVYVIFPLDDHSSYTYTNKDDITLELVDDVGLDLKKVQAYAKSLHKHLGTLQVPDSQKYTLMDFQDRLEWMSMEEKLELVQAHVKSGNKFKIPTDLAEVNLNDFASVQAFIKNYNPQKTNLANALSKGREVMIAGVYYALAVDKYVDVIRDMFGVKVDH